MDRVNEILLNRTYGECLGKIRVCEADRIFCKHDMAHFMDVARLAYIINLREGLNIKEERIYAAALLHDIGRHEQYIDGTPHQEASARIAPAILQACGFAKAESEDIINAIAQHRNSEIKNEKSLAGIIYRADKMSRSCYGCEAEKQCSWSDEKKNLKILL
ncbi:HD domain-containing protein [Robinsoniella peoriensis]|uniref:HD domain-containing protein n=1 Tax=Robinsoniella peoriensis TaxID=180332 RepID=UPI003638978D